MSYLALTYGPEKVIAWVNRTEGSKPGFRAQFDAVFGAPLPNVWRQWIEWERTFQQANLDRLRENPITPYRKVTDRALGSVSRAVVDRTTGTAYLGVFYPGQVSHLASLDLKTGKMKKLCVHRKGATRAFPAGHPGVPEDYRNVGQPVLVPGTMGTASYVLVGTPQAMAETWGSVCHGAGRQMSRTQSLKTVHARELVSELARRNIEVMSASLKTVAEEAPPAYKDVNEVVDVCHGAGISKRVAKLTPIGVVKG